MTILHLFLVIHDNQEVYPLYAENADHAHRVARTWIEITSPSRCRYTVMPCPGGYGTWGSHAFERFTLPGTLYLDSLQEERYATALQ